MIGTISQKLKKGLRNPSRIPGFVPRWLLSRKYDVECENVFATDWDVLIILDACRVDAMSEVKDEFAFLPDTIPSRISVSGSSPGWLAKTFSEGFEDSIRQTAYLSGNPHSRRVLGPEMSGLFADIGGPDDRIGWFDRFVPVWESNWDQELGTVPPDAITDNLIQSARNGKSSRIIAHYMQPHFPSVPDALGSGMQLEDDANWGDDYVWDRYKTGALSLDDVWDAYLSNLRCVLNEVGKVLRNIDAETVVITADHGEAFGEWGYHGHGQNFLRPVREVPWVTTTAIDEGEYTPTIDQDASSQETRVEDKLSALGYRP